MPVVVAATHGHVAVVVVAHVCVSVAMLTRLSLCQAAVPVTGRF